MANNCVSYESLMASLQEIAKSQHPENLYIPGSNVNIPMREKARQTLEFLNQHPQTAKLVREAVSNTSCGDLVKLVEDIPAGYKDLAIGQGVNDLRYGLQQLTSQVASGSVYDNFHKDITSLGRDIAYGSLIIATALIVSAGSYAVLRFTRTK